MKPIVLDRTRIEQYATCPCRGYLTMLWEALKAKATGLEVFPWEAERIKDADPELVEAMQKVILQSTDSRLSECGTEIHDLLKRAFEECKNDLNLVPEWFVKNLPKIKPNIQPMAIRHARHAADLLTEYHVNLIAVEHQVSITVILETGIVYFEDQLRPGKITEIHPAYADVPAQYLVDIGEGAILATVDQADVEVKTPAIIVTMRYDLLGSGKGNLHVMDWKTGFKHLTNSEAAESFQAEFGAWLLLQQEPYKDINTLHWWYFETMFGTKAYAKFVRTEEHPQLPGLTTEVAIQGRVMSAVDLFMGNCKEAWPSEYSCAWCDVIRFCPYADMDCKELSEDPKLYVDKMIVLEALLKRMKGTATKWVKGHGPISGSKMVFTKKKPAEKFTTEFQDIGITKLKPSQDSELDGHFNKGV